MARRLTGAVVVTCLLLTGVGGAVGAIDTADAGTPTLSWKPCVPPGQAGEPVECASLQVPMDWHRPYSGATVALALAKLPATDPANRLGSIVVHMGFPGDTATFMDAHAARLADLRRWFDVIGFDARGVGASGGVACPEPPNKYAIWENTERSAWASHAAANARWAATCRGAVGALTGTLDAWQVARDIEEIRIALGQPRLTYFGQSYGAAWGAAYAEAFPTRVHRMYLDSVIERVDPTPFGRAAPAARVVDEQFARFGLWCRANRACALHPRDAREVWDELVARAQRAPLIAPNGSRVTPHNLRMGVLSVHNEATWPQLARSLARASSGNAADFVRAASRTPAAGPDSPFPSIATATPMNAAARLYWCANPPFAGGFDEIAQLDRKLQAVAPRVGWIFGRELGICAGIPDQGSDPGHSFRAEGVAPILLVAGTRDPLSPPQATYNLAAQLPGSVVALGERGHAVYSAEGCRDLVHAYLVRGVLPAPGTVCPS